MYDARMPNTVALLELLHELEPLLLELTGPVVVKQLRSIASVAVLFDRWRRETQS